MTVRVLRRGQPVPGTPVELVPRDGQRLLPGRATRTTGPKGTLYLSPLSVGRYRVEANVDGTRISREVTVQAGQRTEVEIAIP